MKKPSLAELHPELTEEWHPDKNGPLAAQAVSSGSGKKVWWQCKSNPSHEWQAAVYSRVAGRGCPYCAGKAVTYETSLMALFPDLASQWHSEKNGKLSADKVRPNSNKKVWWICPANASHVWQAVVANRINGHGCPFCAGRIATNTTSLAGVHPEIAAEWHPEKNGDAMPDEVMPGSGKKIWWQCRKDTSHEWQATILNRVKNKSGCPVCAGQMATPETSLAVIRPDIAAEWHPTKNGEHTPIDFLPRSSKKVWWQCPADPSHEWQATIDGRSSGNGCPMCSGRVATPSTSLQALLPSLAAEWHPEKNSVSTPDSVRPGSGQRVWWRCRKDPSHEWQAQVASRVTGRGCPMCAGHIATAATSLRTLHPELSEEWYQVRNGLLTPDDVTPGSNTKVWWRCSTDPSHEWQATITSRTDGKGCPMCSGRVATPSTSLKVLHAALASEWHSDKNGDLTPDNVRPSSHSKVWWCCAKNPSHEWEATIANRVKGSGCPICLGRLAIPSTSLQALLPDLAAEWHSARNGELTPDRVRPRSGKKVWWRCSVDESHEWQASIAGRSDGRGCPFCAGQIATPQTSLRARHPQLAEEWHGNRNGSLSPDDVMPNSNKRVWWRCSIDPSHEWQAPIENRFAGTGCPMCSGRVATPSTSFLALEPGVAAEWHEERNGDLTAADVRPGSNAKVWWRCSVNVAHEWQSTVVNRTRGNGCPYCRLVPRSREEIILACELLSFFSFDLDEHKLVIGGKLVDVDILMPELQLVVEFDGCYWHREKARIDAEKTAALTHAAWRVIRVREEPLEKIGPNDVVVPQKAPKTAADMVLLKIQDVCRIKLPGIQSYLRRKTLVNVDKANSVIGELLAQRSKGQQGICDGQGLLFALHEEQHGPGSNEKNT